MKNKGFTLVELLAVIAILAILVIIAMPNILGLFNQAKVSSFVIDVQKIMDTATTTFTKDALLNSGKTVYYSSESNTDLNTKELNMNGNEKNYFVEMDRNGNFKRIVVYDANYCYDIYTNYGGSSIGNINNSNSKEILSQIKKTSVLIDDIRESGEDTVIPIIVKNGTVVSSYSGIGCDINSINAQETVPEGGKYVDSSGNEYGPGSLMPAVVRTGDRYEYGDYEYRFNQKINDYSAWITDETMNGWGVKLKASSAKQEYGEINSLINNKPIISIDYLFYGCFNLKYPPVLPDSIKSMKYSFSMCIKAYEYPYLPANVEDISYAFESLGSGIGTNSVIILPEDFVIPNKVKNMEGAFKKSVLVYPPEIPSSVTNIRYAFQDSMLFEAPNLEQLTSATQFNSVFEDCDFLIDASNVVLPESAQNLNRMFADCDLLKNPPDLSKAKGNSNGYLIMSQIFYNSPKLTGTIEINSDYVYASNMDFYNVTKPITLKGRCSNLSSAYTQSNITVK